MEALVAVGFAANILQFVDYTCHVVKIECDDAANEILAFVGKFGLEQTHGPALREIPQHRSTHPEEHSLRSLCSGDEQASNEIRQAIQQNEDKLRTDKTIFEALRNATQNRELEAARKGTRSRIHGDMVDTQHHQNLVLQQTLDLKQLVSDANTKLNLDTANLLKLHRSLLANQARLQRAVDGEAKEFEKKKQTIKDTNEKAQNDSAARRKIWILAKAIEVSWSKQKIADFVQKLDTIRASLHPEIMLNMQRSMSAIGEKNSSPMTIPRSSSHVKALAVVQLSDGPASLKTTKDHATTDGGEFGVPSVAELKKSFITLAIHHLADVKIYLLIDELDEYVGDQQEVVDLFKIVTNNPSIKAVISPRSEPAFVEAFESCPRLRVENLTAGNINRYVKIKLLFRSKMRDFDVNSPKRGAKSGDGTTGREGLVYLQPPMRDAVRFEAWTQLAQIYLRSGAMPDARLKRLKGAATSSKARESILSALEASKAEIPPFEKLHIVEKGEERIKKVLDETRVKVLVSPSKNVEMSPLPDHRTPANATPELHQDTQTRSSLRFQGGQQQTKPKRARIVTPVDHSASNSAHNERKDEGIANSDAVELSSGTFTWFLEPKEKTASLTIQQKALLVEMIGTVLAG
ncbi:hypothetical protein K431DRAFT_304148 [Polychaeton citri CBS 116435]|uniref:Uncharacterized protein n=1 Tax=Polychaeton citri CBS 116435 TaxID=1314669 RepID=A0A9P4Q6Y6_9PEZI|nr:hypothetical protein K431DRAFT_304148 [Polychaeton citri CBS 116435]